VQLWQAADSHPFSRCVTPARSTPRRINRLSVSLLSPDGKGMAAGYSDNKMRLWRFAELDKMSKPATVGRCGPSPTARMASFWLQDQKTRTCKCCAWLTGSEAAWRPHGRRALAWPSHRTDRSWPPAPMIAQSSFGARSRAQACAPPAGPSRASRRGCLCPHAQTLASGSDTVRLWQVNEPGLPRLLERPQNLKGPIKGLVFSVDGQVLAAFGTSNYIALWDMSDGRSASWADMSRLRQPAHPDARLLRRWAHPGRSGSESSCVVCHPVASRASASSRLRSLTFSSSALRRLQAARGVAVCSLPPACPAHPPAVLPALWSGCG